MYDYGATVLVVHDGDTVKVDIDLGFDAHYVTWIRLQGINAPELSTPAGVSARDALAGLLLVGSKVSLRSTKAAHPVTADKYGGRWDGVLSFSADPGEPTINQWMLDNGFAVVMKGVDREGPVEP